MMTNASSPEKEATGDASNQEHSPTRVWDFQDSGSSVKKDNDVGEEDSPQNPTTTASDDNSNDIPDISMTPLHRKQQQQQPVRPLFLATIEDNSSVSSSETNVSREQRRQKYREERKNIRHPPHGVEEEKRREEDESAAPPTTRRSSSFVAEADGGQGKHPQSREAKALDEVQRYKEMANKRASHGHETDALRTYGRALRLIRSELSRIKKQLELAGQTPTLTGRLTTAWTQGTNFTADIKIAMAILYERLGDYENAIKCCDEAREVYSNYLYASLHGGSNDADMVDVEQHQAQMDHMLSRLATARDSFADRKSMHEEVIETRRRMLLTRDKEARANLYEEVVRQLRSVLDKECECLGDGHPQVADTLGILARVYSEGNEIDVAIDEQAAAVSILRVAVGPHHPRTANATRDLAKLYEARNNDEKDLEQAVAYYKSAIISFRESLGNQHATVGSTLNNLAVLYLRRKEYDQALELLSDALISYESAIGSGSGINPDVAQVWKNTGECYSLRGEWESALFAYSSALGVQQDARRCAETGGSKEGKPSRSAALALSGIDNVSIADTLSRLAKATAALGQYDDAVDSYKESLHFYRLALDIATKRSNGKPTQEMVDMQDRVAHALYLIAETREKNGDFDKAIALYSEALELRLTSDAQREDQRINMVHCAMNLAGIGSVHIRKGEFTDACKVLQESTKFLEAHGVPRDHGIFTIIQDRMRMAEQGILPPTLAKGKGHVVEVIPQECASPKKNGGRSVVLDQMVERQMDEGDYDGAMRTLTKLLAVHRSRLRKNKKKHFSSNCTNEENEVAKTLGRFASVLVLKGEKKQAESLFNEAIRIYKLNGMSDKDPAVQDLAGQLEDLL